MLRLQQRVSRNSFGRSVISVEKISTNVNCVQPRTLFVIITARKDTLELPVNLQNTIFLGAVLNGKTNAKDWTVDVSVDNTEIKFKVDTGADVDIISDDVYGKYFNHRCLLSCNENTKDPDQMSLPILGYIKCSISKAD